MSTVGIYIYSPCTLWDRRKPVRKPTLSTPPPRSRTPPPVVNQAGISRVVNRARISRVVNRARISRVVNRPGISRVVNRPGISRVVNRPGISRVVNRAIFPRVVNRARIPRVVNRAIFPRVVNRAIFPRVVNRARIPLKYRSVFWHTYDSPPGSGRCLYSKQNFPPGHSCVWLASVSGCHVGQCWGSPWSVQDWGGGVIISLAARQVGHATVISR